MTFYAASRIRNLLREALMRFREMLRECYVSVSNRSVCARNVGGLYVCVFGWFVVFKILFVVERMQ
ncbi:MAG: hypothetical protein CL920_04670 [Deltaproteobacteria bacterium]|nr:hypothetical protein [Deltaproteobacteria bacterium]MBU47972.1 hypothetical protein [Deltaproteobacteria bacterium]